MQPEGGRFRSFLLVALRHYLTDEYRLRTSARRGGEPSTAPWQQFDAGEWEAVADPSAISPEDAFDRSWAEELVARTMQRLQQRWEKRAELFMELRFTVESPGDGAKYSEIASRFGMTSGAVSKAAHDLRQQFAQEIRNEIQQTVADDDDLEEELRYLVRLLRN